LKNVHTHTHTHTRARKGVNLIRQLPHSTS